MEYCLTPSADLNICINATTAAGEADIRDFDEVIWEKFHLELGNLMVFKVFLELFLSLVRRSTQRVESEGNSSSQLNYPVPECRFLPSNLSKHRF